LISFSLIESRELLIRKLSNQVGKTNSCF